MVTPREKERHRIGEWAKRNKEKRRVLMEKNRGLQQLDDEVKKLESEVVALKRKRGLLQDKKVHMPRRSCRTPTKLGQENTDTVEGISPNDAAKRRKLTYQAAKIIHSGSSKDDTEASRATTDGLWNTLVTKTTSKSLTELCSRSKKIVNKVIPAVVNKSVSKFEKSDENMIRSISVLYRGGVISKRQYSSIRSSESYEYDVERKKRKNSEFAPGCRIPSLVPYKDLMKVVNSVDIGKLNELPRVSSNSQKEKESEEVDENFLPAVPGLFIDLKERLLQLADFYLLIDRKRPNFLKWFGKERGHFLVALGADGAPFGKTNQACAWLVSFLNVMERVASPDDNFLLCGGNCSEDHPAMIEYGKKLKDDIKDIESQTFTIRSVNVRFEFKLLPSDMKWISKFAGELNNAATYPSPYANVKRDELSLRGLTLGNEPDDKWHPWSYDFRVTTAKTIKEFKKGQKKANTVLKADNLHKKVLKKIADLKSRQETEPSLGPVVQNAKCDTLHLGNNCWGHWHKLILNHILTKANIAKNVKSVFELPESNPLRKHLKALRFAMHCKRLYNQIICWFKEKRLVSNFECRFIGEETRKFCNGFMHLIIAAVGDVDVDHPTNVVPITLAKMGIHLRNSVSLSSRVSNITNEDLEEMERECKFYFNIASIFHSVTLSVWTMGHCVPFHTKELMKELGVGLGINTMQGRESKHQQLATYAEFSLVKNRWEKVFRHEHMSLIWLRMQNPFADGYKKSEKKYIPEQCYKEGFCICGLTTTDGSSTACKYCNSNLSRMVSVCASRGALTSAMESVLKRAEKISKP